MSPDDLLPILLKEEVSEGGIHNRLKEEKEKEEQGEGGGRHNRQ